MKCFICEKEEWENLDHLRDIQYWKIRDVVDIKTERLGFQVCRSCGYVTYEERPGLEDWYNSSAYRKTVNAHNLTTGNRKIAYHKAMLYENVEIAGKDVLDVGCAQGQFLADMRDNGAQRLKGYELTEGLARYAENIYGIEVSRAKNVEEPPKTWDLVTCYHVLEHLRDPLDALRRIREALKDDGRLYLSVPVWFESLDDIPIGGGDCKDWEYVYHANHIQVFSRQSLQNLFARAGFEYTYMNDQIHGHTFVLRKCEPSDIVKEDWKEKVRIMTAQKEAGKALSAGDWNKAIEHYVDFPDAWLTKSAHENQKDPAGQLKAIDEGMSKCNLHSKFYMQKAMVSFQWEDRKQSKTALSERAPNYTINMAIEYLNKALELKPGNETAHYHLGLIKAHYFKDYSAAIDHWRECIRLNVGQYYQDCETWIGWAAARIEPKPVSVSSNGKKKLAGVK